MSKEQQIEYVGVWEYIPRNAFLYFPEGEEIKIGSGDKQWRKIFENNEPYEQFQLEALKKLEQKLLISNIKVHPWFDDANKLRYLQANKWKKTPTCEAIAEYSRYRYSQFPFKETAAVLSMLKKGTFYLCGRDHQYRPIIVADINRFNEEDIDLIPPTLVYLMEFMINNLLIQGQVENYVLIMNLENFSMSQKSLVTKIIGFTSNSYRGRLFVSYLLGAPSILRWGWNSLAATFVSQNTLRKIKVTGDLYLEDMWSHIDKKIIQKKYGGSAEQIHDFWPPSKQKLTYESSDANNKLISVQEYNQKFRNLKLQKRKILKSLLRRNSISIHSKNRQTFPEVEQDPQLKSKKILENIDRSSLTDTTILVESSVFPDDLKAIHPFFKDKKYKQIQ